MVRVISYWDPLLLQNDTHEYNLAWFLWNGCLFNRQQLYRVLDAFSHDICPKEMEQTLARQDSKELKTLCFF